MGRKKTAPASFDLFNERGVSWQVITVAAIAAGTAQDFFGGKGERFWTHGGTVDDEQQGEAESKAEVLVLASFIRQHPTAPAEALYRYAAGQGIHTGPADAWEAQPFWWRQAYSTFRATLLDLDTAVFAERNAMLALQQRDAAGDGPVVAAAIGGDVEGTALELQPDPLATREGMVLGRTDDGQQAQIGQAAAFPAPGAGPAVVPVDSRPAGDPGGDVDGADAAGDAGDIREEASTEAEAQEANAEDVKDAKPAKTGKSGKAA